MCPDFSKPVRRPWRGFPLLADNPLYDYLLDLQERRVRLLDTLVPRRHLVMQVFIASAIILLWLTDLLVPSPGLKGFSIALILLVGPFAITGGLFLAGWHFQMLAVKAYPSPLDLPRAFEVLLATPLTGTEIVAATIGAYLRFPLIGFSIGRLALVLGNFALIALVIFESASRGTLPSDVLFMALNLYIPAFCVYIFFPVFSALDVLLVPYGWFRRDPSSLESTTETFMGRSGRIATTAMLLVILPLMFKIQQFDQHQAQALFWILSRLCPAILIFISGMILIFVSALPNHIERIRRG